MGAGDMAVQQITRYRHHKQGGSRVKHDWIRTGRLTLIGLCLGPLNHGWYRFLDRAYPSIQAAAIGKKILLDQIIASPLLIVFFLTGSGLMQKQTLSECGEEIRNKFITIYKADWLIWPAAQTINFLFLPPQYRVLYVAMVTLFYDGFLSYMKHEDPFHEENSTEVKASGSVHVTKSSASR